MEPLIMTKAYCNTWDHLSRRTLLRAAGGAAFLGPVARSLTAQHEQGDVDRGRPRSVILLWLDGGPSQWETFDPQPGSRSGGSVGRIRTSAAGIEIADTLPRLATQIHRTAIIRSVTGKEGDHERATHNIKTGYRPDPTLVHPSLGAILCHQSDSGADIPRHVSILPGRFPARGGYLGASYDAFKVYDPAGRIPDVSKRVSDDRYARRMDDLLGTVETSFARGRLVDLDRTRTLHAVTIRAAEAMMSSEQLDAFDVSREPAGVLDSFGHSPFGRGCLAAARLIEVGVRCVEVTLGGWDSHINNHSLQSAACHTLDSAAEALIARLDERDLLRTTLVVCGGEFGRTPRINAAEGRDHWPHGFSILLAGCGVRGGVVHGATSINADFDPNHPSASVRDPVTIADVHATMLRALGLRPSTQLQTPVGRPMALSEGTPIETVLDA